MWNMPLLTHLLQAVLPACKQEYRFEKVDGQEKGDEIGLTPKL